MTGQDDRAYKRMSKAERDAFYYLAKRIRKGK